MLPGSESKKSLPSRPKINKLKPRRRELRKSERWSKIKKWQLVTLLITTQKPSRKTKKTSDY